MQAKPLYSIRALCIMYTYTVQAASVYPGSCFSHTARPGDISTRASEYAFQHPTARKRNIDTGRINSSSSAREKLTLSTALRVKQQRRDVVCSKRRRKFGRRRRLQGRWEERREHFDWVSPTRAHGERRSKIKRLRGYLTFGNRQELGEAHTFYGMSEFILVLCTWNASRFADANDFKLDDSSALVFLLSGTERASCSKYFPSVTP